ncbi:MAG: rhodanese-like domain-containing protein [Marinobacterium sp.]|nr:rhodanese-like domain-containing protein [Marinobacterium sp.]
MKAVCGLLAGLVLSLNVLAEVKVISQQQLLAWQQSGKELLLLDTRSAGEFAVGHIKGAINIDFRDIPDAMARLQDWKDKTVVVYCRSGRRAGIAENYLEQQGFTGLHHLAGDILGWNRAGRPLVK